MKYDNILITTTERDVKNLLTNICKKKAIYKHYNHGNNTSLASLGVTFCEINGRAYVQTVERKSRAEAAGVCPRDCVQYAAVLAQEWNDPLGEDFAEIRKHALEREESGQRITYKELKALLQTGVLTNMLE